MRRTVEAVWLEDKLDDAHKRRVTYVKSAIEKKGYESNIKEISTLEEATEILSRKDRRVDFFISDYNLDDGTTGLDYLIEVRQNGSFKQFFVLYSNVDYNEIKEGIIAKFRETQIELFSNFTFISLEYPNVVERDFEKAVEMSLSRWDELNAIRGLYMCEHAELEWRLKERFREDPELKNKYKDGPSYRDLFFHLKNKTYPNYKKIYENIFKEWDQQIELRNALAHTSEDHDPEKGFYIQSNVNNSIVIYENELDIKRKNLIELKEKAKFLIKNSNRPPLPSNDRETVRN